MPTPALPLTDESQLDHERCRAVVDEFNAHVGTGMFPSPPGTQRCQLRHDGVHQRLRVLGRRGRAPGRPTPLAPGIAVEGELRDDERPPPGASATLSSSRRIRSAVHLSGQGSSPRPRRVGVRDPDEQRAGPGRSRRRRRRRPRPTRAGSPAGPAPSSMRRSADRLKESTLDEIAHDRQRRGGDRHPARRRGRRASNSTHTRAAPSPVARADQRGDRLVGLEFPAHPVRLAKFGSASGLSSRRWSASLTSNCSRTRSGRRPEPGGQQRLVVVFGQPHAARSDPPGQVCRRPGCSTACGTSSQHDDRRRAGVGAPEGDQAHADGWDAAVVEPAPPTVVAAPASGVPGTSPASRSHSETYSPTPSTSRCQIHASQPRPASHPPHPLGPVAVCRDHPVGQHRGRPAVG